MASEVQKMVLDCFNSVMGSIEEQSSDSEEDEKDFMLGPA